MIVSSQRPIQAKPHTAFGPMVIVLLLFLLLGACTGGGGGTDTPSPKPKSLDEFIRAKKFSGTILVRKNGHDILRKAYGLADKSAGRKNKVQTRFRIGSLTKSFTALGVVQLKQNGLISNYSDPISDYVPSLSLNSQITIKDILTHRSGIPDYLEEDSLDQEKPYSPEELVALVSDKPLEFTPGSKFEYSNTNYVILGILIEKLSGQSYYDYTQSHILNPLGLSATEAGKSTITGEDYAKGYEYSSQSKEAEYIDMSIAYSAGVLSSNISDLEDWAASFINLSLISQQEYDEIFATETYGYGWLTKPIDGRNMFWHTGGINGFESVIMVLPDVNGVIIMLSNIENAKNGDISKYILDTQF